MAAKSMSGLLVLLAAALMAASSSLVQAQLVPKLNTDIFHALVNNALCSEDSEIQTCGRVILESATSAGAKPFPLGCCGALLRVAFSGGKGKACACSLGEAAATMLKVDVDRICQAASNGGVAGGPSTLKEFCMAPGPGSAPQPEP